MSERTRVAIGLDIGSTNTKAVIVELDGGVVLPLALASTPTPSDGDELVERVLQLVTEVVHTSSRTPECVGIASMAESGLPLSSDYRPLTGIIRWDGSRGLRQAQSLAERIPAADLFAATGVQLGAKTPLATWLWLAEECPDVVTAMARWAGIADLIGLAMSGELVTDHTLAGRTMAYRLPEEGSSLPPTFDAGLLGLAALDPGRMPSVRRPGAAWPTLNSERFALAGLPPGIPVVIAGHDHAVGAYFAGLRAPGDAVDSLGTAEAILMLVDHRPDSERLYAAGLGLVRTVRGADEAVLAGSSSAGAMVAWWRAELGKDAQAIMDEALLRLPAVSRHVVLPYLRGRQCPARDLAAPAGLMTDALERDPVGETLAMFEGVAFQARWMLDAVSAVAGRQPNGVVVSGGAAAANSALMSMKASLSPAPMRRVLTPEPVATGAALIALERSGLLASVPAAPTEPIPNTLPADHYDEAYRRFVGTAVRHTTERHTA